MNVKRKQIEFFPPNDLVFKAVGTNLVRALIPEPHLAPMKPLRFGAARWRAERK